jgi:riboflavin biosynthesis pyrimidine reductase
MPSREPDSAAGTTLSPLGAAGNPFDADDNRRLGELYAYPDHLTRCWVRANFISSVDGGATTDGRSGGLAGPGDRAVFGALRELCDVVLVGAGTVRTENYSGAQFSAQQRRARDARGQAEVPPIAVVTASGRLDRDLLVFTRTEIPPLVLTTAAAVPSTRNRLGALAEVLDCSGDDPGAVDMAAVLSTLAARGLQRVLTEGGPSLLGTVIAAGLLDELCLTVAPLLVGGLARRIATGPGAALTRMRRAHLLADAEGYLYARYIRAD